ncbi:MAG: AraC family transcriptional regulator [Bdellovibrionales bacterium]|nr:AraC family transcriptional regulator [Bdellovibrionales bacterium]
MEIVLELIRFLGISLMLFLSGYLSQKHRSHPAARIGALFSFGMAIYLLMPLILRHTDNPVLIGIPLFATFSNSFLFWMFCRSIFSERAPIRWIHYSLWGASQLISYMVFFRLPESLFQWGSQVSEFEFIRKLLPHGLYLGFILAGIVSSQKDARADLVSSRIQLRRAFLAVVAFYGVLISVTEILLQGQHASPAIDVIHYSILLVLTGLFFREIKNHPELFSDSGVKAETFEPSPLQKELKHQMEVGKVYRQEGLTIVLLAERLRTQEYLLRRCINQELGFRNFNDFLNHYRIQEACTRLKAEPGLPILNLSLELGYRSLAPFNRAFKEKTGATPTQFRLE